MLLDQIASVARRALWARAEAEQKLVLLGGEEAELTGRAVRLGGELATLERQAEAEERKQAGALAVLRGRLGPDFAQATALELRSFAGYPGYLASLFAEMRGVKDAVARIDTRLSGILRQREALSKAVAECGALVGEDLLAKDLLAKATALLPATRAAVDKAVGDFRRDIELASARRPYDYFPQAEEAGKVALAQVAEKEGQLVAEALALFLRGEGYRL
jgi:hypothetical protein